MGNQTLVRMLSDQPVTDITSKEVYFQDGLIKAIATFQRHNYQFYQIRFTEADNPLKAPTTMPLALRVIRSMNDDESIEILKEMQQKVTTFGRHNNLLRYVYLAFIQDNEPQRAGLPGLPGLYKSVSGTTNYKTDAQQFLLMEEDHLSILPPNFFNPMQGQEVLLRQRFTLKQFLDRVLPSQVLTDLFASDELILYKLIIQILEGLAYLNQQPLDPETAPGEAKRFCNHQEVVPQNIILQFVPSADSEDDVPQAATDYHRKFNVKLSEYLNIRILSDIANKRSDLMDTQTKLAQMKVAGMRQEKTVNQIINELKYKEGMYSQYDPPEKVELEPIKLKEGITEAQVENDFRADYFQITAAKLDNLNCDIWSLGIIILEIYLSIYVHKSDRRKQVFNLKLNLMPYQSRCTLINELLDIKKNPVFCSLVKEMLRDSNLPTSQKDHMQIYDEQNLYEDLILNQENKGALQCKQPMARPTAERLLTFNRILHYFSFIADNPLPDQFLPSNINLLKVFTSNEMFVPLLVQCGMQNVLNKNKALVAFISLMTLVIKKKQEAEETEEDGYDSADHQVDSIEDAVPTIESGVSHNPQQRLNKVTSLVVETLIQTQGYIQIVELVNFALNQDLQPLMLYFNQKIGVQEYPGETELERLERLEREDSMEFARLFEDQFAQQKTTGLQLLIDVMDRLESAQRTRLKKISRQVDTTGETEPGLGKLMGDLTSAGLVPLVILLLQKIRSQKWAIVKNLGALSKEEAENEQTTLTLELIERFAASQFSKTLLAFVDKTGFFDLVVAILTAPFSSQDRPQSFRYPRGQSPPTEGALLADKSRRLGSQNSEDSQQDSASIPKFTKSVATVHPARDQPFSDDQSRTIDWRQAFRERLRLFLFRCACALSDTTIKNVVREFSDKLGDEEVLAFLKVPGLKQVGSIELKKFIVETLMKRFLALHLKTNKTLTAKKGSVAKSKGRGAAEDDDLIDAGAKSVRKADSSMNEGAARKTPSHKTTHSSLGIAKGSKGDQLLCDISEVLLQFLDCSQSSRKLRLVQHCLDNQICLSFFQTQFMAGQQSGTHSAAPVEEEKEETGRKRRPASTISPNKHSVYLEPSSYSISAVEPATGTQFLAPFFFECPGCSNQVFCVVCTLKFHQGHRDLRPVAVRGEDKYLKCRYVQLQQEARESEKDLLAEHSLFSKFNYNNQTYVWDYQPDLYVQQVNYRGLLDKGKKKAKATPPSDHDPKTNIRFDIYDRETVFTEKNGSHFIFNDFDQHTLLSQEPLACSSFRERAAFQMSKDPLELIREFKQSYFEIQIHSGGFYDQIQIGLVLLDTNDLDPTTGSSSILNSFKNDGIIPGFEPFSIGYHGDDSKVYYNLSKSVGLEELIKLAQKDPSKLLEEADANSPIFNLSSQVVYGGSYGPQFSAGDRIGCGILPLQEDGLYATYFTHNGVKLPGIRLNATPSFRFYPVISVKGKLTHFEVIQRVKDFGFNSIGYQDEMAVKLINWVKHNDKFMRSISQFNQILQIKGSSSNTYVASTVKKRSADSTDGKSKGAPARLVDFLSKDHSASTKKPLFAHSKSQANFEIKREGNMAHRQSLDAGSSGPLLSTIPHNESHQQSSMLLPQGLQQMSINRNLVHDQTVLPPPAPLRDGLASQKPKAFGRKDSQPVISSTKYKVPSMAKGNFSMQGKTRPARRAPTGNTPSGHPLQSHASAGHLPSGTPKTSVSLYQKSLANVQQQSRLYYESVTNKQAPRPRYPGEQKPVFK